MIKFRNKLLHIFQLFTSDINLLSRLWKPHEAGPSSSGID